MFIRLYLWRNLPLVAFAFTLTIISLLILDEFGYSVIESSRHDPRAGRPPEFDFSIVKSPRNVESWCEEKDGKEEKDVRLFIMIPSAPHHFANRQIIRRTWIQYFAAKGVSDATHVFLLGRPLDSEVQKQVDSEHQTHDDLLQLDFLDSYHNLTLKTLSGLCFIHSLCHHSPSFSFVLKADDDVFVKLPRLLPHLAALKSCQRHTSKTLFCHTFYPASPPHRAPWSKWALTSREYPERRLPPYCDGSAYLMTGDMVGFILEAAKSVNFVYLEDVYTGRCAQKIGGVELVTLPKGMLVHTVQSGREIERLYENNSDERRFASDNITCD